MVVNSVAKEVQATIIEPSRMADEHRFLEEEQSPGSDDADPLDGSEVAGPVPGDRP